MKGKHITVILSICILSILGHTQKITVVTEEWGPYNYTENGVVTGISTEIIQATLNLAGIKAHIEIVPWARAYNRALKKENILIYSIYRSEEREALFHWIGPINAPTNYYLYKLKSRNDISLDSIPDARKYITGVMNNDNAHQHLKKHGFKEVTHLDVVHDEILNIKKLLAGRIDLIPSAELSLSYRMHKHNLPYHELEKALVIYGNEARSYMAFNKNTSTEIVQRVQKAFDTLKADGIVQKTTDKYLKHQF